MSRITYRATPKSSSGKYGVCAWDETARRGAVAMPFLKSIAAARRLAAQLTRKQTPISEFCERFLEKTL